MRRLALTFILTLLTGCATSAIRSPSVDANALIGSWQVDLRPRPGAPAYYQEFVVSAVDGNRFIGSFYGAEVSQARINTEWGAVRIAFVTADGSGQYHHSATLIGDRLEGLTNATGRDFLSYWSAQRVE